MMQVCFKSPNYIYFHIYLCDIMGHLMILDSFSKLSWLHESFLLQVTNSFWYFSAAVTCYFCLFVCLFVCYKCQIQSDISLLQLLVIFVCLFVCLFVTSDKFSLIFLCCSYLLLLLLLWFFTHVFSILILAELHWSTVALYFAL